MVKGRDTPRRNGTQSMEDKSIDDDYSDHGQLHIIAAGPSFGTTYTDKTKEKLDQHPV